MYAAIRIDFGCRIDMHVDDVVMVKLSKRTAGFVINVVHQQSSAPSEPSAVRIAPQSPLVLDVPA